MQHNIFPSALLQQQQKTRNKPNQQTSLSLCHCPQTYRSVLSRVIAVQRSKLGCIFSDCWKSWRPLTPNINFCLSLRQLCSSGCPFCDCGLNFKGCDSVQRALSFFLRSLCSVPGFPSSLLLGIKQLTFLLFFFFPHILYTSHLFE